jgi:hypothetical protein
MAKPNAANRGAGDDARHRYHNVRVSYIMPGSVDTALAAILRGLY